VDDPEFYGSQRFPDWEGRSQKSTLARRAALIVENDHSVTRWLRKGKNKVTKAQEIHAGRGVAAAVALGLGGRSVLRRIRGLNLRGQVILITGSSRGLGFVIAQELAREGCHLVLCGRNQGPLEGAAQQITQLGAEVVAVRCDVSDRKQVEGLVDRATSHFGRVDVLVNNAGVMTVGPVQNQTVSDFEEAMKGMFWGVAYPTLALLPQMLERGNGRIVNITSLGGKVSAPHLLPYSCAKSAAIAFSEGLRAEVSKYGVTVVTVVPGFMRTGSPLNAYFKGNHQAEYTWFTLAGNMPLASMDARRAARRIIQAMRSGVSEQILTPQAQLAVRFHGLFPGITTDALTLFSRFLPEPDGVGTDRRLGKDSETWLTRSFITALGRAAARRYNQE
jgi:short-subunit dehydrogenase